MNAFMAAHAEQLSHPGASRTTLRGHPDLGDLCRAQLQIFVSQCSGVTAGIVASADGFEVASIQHAQLAPQKVAAMSSSMLALGDAVLGEADLSGCQNVVIESKSGVIVMLAVGDARSELLLCAVADHNAMLGQLLWAARQCCDRIRASLVEQGL